MSQAGKYPDCEICEYKIFMEDAQTEVESEPSTSNQQTNSAIPLRAKQLLSTVKNGMTSEEIHNIRGLLADIAEQH